MTEIKDESYIRLYSGCLLAVLLLDANYYLEFHRFFSGNIQSIWLFKFFGDFSHTNILFFSSYIILLMSLGFLMLTKKYTNRLLTIAIVSALFFFGIYESMLGGPKYNNIMAHSKLGPIYCLCSLSLKGLFPKFLEKISLERIILTIMGSTLFMAGANKILFGGLDWFTGETMQTYLFWRHHISDNAIAFAAAKIPALCVLFSVSAVLIELAVAPLAIFSKNLIFPYILTGTLLLSFYLVLGINFMSYYGLFLAPPILYYFLNRLRKVTPF